MSETHSEDDGDRNVDDNDESVHTHSPGDPNSKDGDNEKHRSRSRSKRRKKHKRRHHSSSSRSSSRNLDIRRAVEESLQRSLSQVLDPIQRQIAEISKGNSEASGSNDVNVDIQDLREKQQILDIKTKAATMKTACAQAQYRIMASVKRRITNSIAQLEEIRLTCEFEDPTYKAIKEVTEELTKAETEAADRISLLFKADEDPKVGWRALTIFDEKKKREEKADPETDKLFATCVKQVQDTSKKFKGDGYSVGKRPFRPRPGWNSGSSYSGFFLRVSPTFLHYSLYDSAQ